MYTSFVRQETLKESLMAYGLNEYLHIAFFTKNTETHAALTVNWKSLQSVLKPSSPVHLLVLPLLT